MIFIFLLIENAKSADEDLERNLHNCRSSHRRCSIKKGVLKNFTNFTGKGFTSLRPRNFIKKETLTQVFSCEI